MSKKNEDSMMHGLFGPEFAGMMARNIAEQQTLESALDRLNPRNRMDAGALDILRDRVKHYDKLVKHHGSPAQIKGELLGIVRDLATHARVTPMDENWVGLPLLAERILKSPTITEARLDELVSALRNARDEIMPAAPSYTPGKDTLPGKAVIAPLLEHLQRFTDAAESDRRSAGRSGVLRQLPNLDAYAMKAERQLELYDIAVKAGALAEEWQAGCDDAQHDAAMSKLEMDIKGFKGDVPKKERSGAVKEALKELRKATSPKELAHAAKVLQGEVVAFACHSTKDIKDAHHADRKITKQAKRDHVHAAKSDGEAQFDDPFTSRSHMLDEVYKVRWALAADIVIGWLDSKKERKLITDSSIKPEPVPGKSNER